MTTSSQPFILAVPDQAITDLRNRVERTRCPDQAPEEPSAYGTDVGYLAAARRLLATGYAKFPREILRPPRSLAARTYTDIRRWSVMPRGGHFAALEQPEALAHEIREFYRPLRG